MKKLCLRLWEDDCGALIATEWVFIATILIIGIVAGLKSVQTAVLNELEEFAGAVGALSQSYSIGGVEGCCSNSAGSRYIDTVNTFSVDTCTGQIDPLGANCPD
jgi:Flp pilus assembly pilin Flp